MTQPDLFLTEPKFDGETFVAERDGHRLRCQLVDVRTLMADGKWRTLAEICSECGYPDTSIPGISARLRDLRKLKFGAHSVERRYLHTGMWEYRMGY